MLRHATMKLIILLFVVINSIESPTHVEIQTTDSTFDPFNTQQERIIITSTSNRFNTNTKEIMQQAHNLTFIQHNGRAAAHLYHTFIINNNRNMVELIYQSSAALFFTYFPSDRSDILLGERIAKHILLETAMTTSQILGGTVIRTLASQIASTATAALSRPSDSLLYYGYPFDNAVYQEKWLNTNKWQHKTDRSSQQYCDQWDMLSDLNLNQIYVQRNVIPQNILELLLEKLHSDSNNDDNDDFFANYEGDLRSYYISTNKIKHNAVPIVSVVSKSTKVHTLMKIVGNLILTTLSNRLKNKIHGFEWWIHRRPFANDLYKNESSTPHVIPGMRLHVDGDHIRQQRYGKSQTTLHTALLYIGSPVGSPTILIDQEKKGTYFFEGSIGDILHFDGTQIYHGALPVLGTVEKGVERIVVAVGYWGKECLTNGRVCVKENEDTKKENEENEENEERNEDTLEERRDKKNTGRLVETCNNPFFLKF